MTLEPQPGWKWVGNFSRSRLSKEELAEMEAILDDMTARWRAIYREAEAEYPDPFHPDLSRQDRVNVAIKRGFLAVIEKEMEKCFAAGIIYPE